MNGIALLIGLGPLLGWGLFPTIASKIGGKPVNQIIGTTFGTFIFALVYNLVQGIALPSGAALIWSIISGIGWASAQILTFHSFTLVGSSRAMPITTAFQRSEEHTSELQSRFDLVCRLLLEKKNLTTLPHQLTST